MRSVLKTIKGGVFDGMLLRTGKTVQKKVVKRRDRTTVPLPQPPVPGLVILFSTICKAPKSSPTASIELICERVRPLCSTT